MINLQVLKSQLQELGYLDICEFCFNGEEAIITATKIIEKSLGEQSNNMDFIRPISLMLLDF